MSGDGWHTPIPPDHPANRLLSADAVRERCAAVMAHVERGASEYFIWQPERLQDTARYVADTIRRRYPDLAVPYHSRWRHFEAGGVDRTDALFGSTDASPAELARRRIDLVIPSVLLDAGAGPDWRYVDAQHQQTLTRSEGLAVASLALFESGALSAHTDDPLRADASALSQLESDSLTDAFQVSSDNPLIGVPGRLNLMRRLGEVIAATPAVFGHPARLGNLYDYLTSKAPDGRLEAATILQTLLHALGPVWPSRLSLDSIPLGDCWHHPASPDGWVPFHKLTQWLTYSLLEPLEAAGLTITGLDRLTGLPEYRNGGLLLDTGLLMPRDPVLFDTTLTVDSRQIVEWRAVTVIALDRLADAVRSQLSLSAADFPLARVLEGGTWAAGRALAAERRPGGTPPLKLESDGTVF